jgi:hypothetical protein
MQRVGRRSLTRFAVVDLVSFVVLSCLSGGLLDFLAFVNRSVTVLRCCARNFVVGVLHRRCPGCRTNCTIFLVSRWFQSHSLFGLLRKRLGSPTRSLMTIMTDRRAGYARVIRSKCGDADAMRWELVLTLLRREERQC